MTCFMVCDRVAPRCARKESRAIEKFWAWCCLKSKHWIRKQEHGAPDKWFTYCNTVYNRLITSKDDSVLHWNLQPNKYNNQYLWRVRKQIPLINSFQSNRSLCTMSIILILSIIWGQLTLHIIHSFFELCKPPTPQFRLEHKVTKNIFTTCSGWLHYE